VHPGGPVMIEQFGGHNATEAFMTYHLKRFPHDRMKDYLI